MEGENREVVLDERGHDLDDDVLDWGLTCGGAESTVEGGARVAVHDYEA
jgi:hypothetical protein